MRRKRPRFLRHLQEPDGPDNTICPEFFDGLQPRGTIVTRYSTSHPVSGDDAFGFAFIKVQALLRFGEQLCGDKAVINKRQ